MPAGDTDRIRGPRFALIAGLLGIAIAVGSSSLASAGPTQDLDGDGVTFVDGDCNDNNPSIHPGAIDTPGDSVDQDCDNSDAVTADTVLTKGPKPKTTKRRPKFEFHAEPGTYAPAGFTCFLDGQELATCESVLRIPKQLYGRHKLKIIAVDEHGFEDQSPVVSKFKIVHEH